MTVPELRPCPNCGGTKIILWTKERSDIRGKWKYYCCENCALQSLGSDDRRGAREYWNEGIGLHFDRVKTIPFEGAEDEGD